MGGGRDKKVCGVAHGVASWGGGCVYEIESVLFIETSQHKALKYTFY